jgi:hypothetical protein
MKPIFKHALESFAETIRPNAETAALIRSARHELADIVGNGTEQPYLGVHIRRGDRRGSSWTYHNSYLPIDLYTEAVSKTWARLHAYPSRGQIPTVYIASDSTAAQTAYTDAAEATRIFSLSRSSNAELREIASRVEYDQKNFKASPLKDRIQATTGMIVDFALVSGMWAWKTDLTPSATICGIR